MGARAGVVLFCGVLLLGGLAGGELVRNEGLRARLAAEAYAGGGWLVPTLYDQPHLTKPPGMTLLIGLCSLPAGAVTPLTARLPSVLAGAVAVLLVWRTFARLLGGRAGLVAAAVLPCSLLWLDRVPSAEIDLVQLAWVTAAVLLAGQAFQPDLQKSQAGKPDLQKSQAGKPDLRWPLALLCVAGGFFTKWTAPLFFYLTLVPYLAWRGQLRRLLSPGHLLGVAIFVALALGWLLVAGHTAGWDVFTQTLGREALLRFSPGHHPRPYPWDELLTFPLGFLAANLPWSLCLLVAVRPSFGRLWDDRTRALWQLAICWLFANLAFWTVAPGHRPRHLLPAQPALAVLAALVWVAWLDGRLRWPLRLRPAVVLTGLLAVFLVIKIAFVAYVLPERARQRGPRRGGEALAALVPPGEVLYLRRLKDEGLLFYYGGPARRLGDAGPPPGAWCLFTEAEWRSGPCAGRLRGRLRDGQGAPLVLVRTE